jgi:hypothetical protein
MKEMAFPEHIAKYLDKTFTPKGEKSILGRAYDKWLKAWKTQATVLRPAFHVTNFAGNTFQSFLAGMNPMRFIEAAGWDAAKAKGALDNAPAIGRYTPQEIDAFMNKYGIGGAGHNFTSELLQDGADKVLIAKLNGETLSKNPLKHPIRASRAFGQWVEDFSKRSLFLDQLHKGKSLEDAAATVDKFLFDYGDLTDFEKTYARRLMPFYTWMRKNVPLQAEMVVKKPHAYAAVSKGINDIEDVTKENGSFNDPRYRAEYLQDNNSIQLPTEKGKNRKYLNTYLPYQDLNKLPIPGGSSLLDSARDIASGLDPAVKTAVELLTNKSLYFNKPLYDEDLGVTGDKQKIPDYLNILPDAVKNELFTKVKINGKDQYQTPALAKYILQQLPVMNIVGKSTSAITTPEGEDSSTETKLKNLISALAGIRTTERTPQQEAKDRKANITKAKRTHTKERKQSPLNKSRIDSLYEEYLKQ